ncbi:MAG: HNH endonuclease [Armatimonadetes bacterium]|nr:HNH endonuclease [Armatimonadota bacterium]
MTRTAPLPRIVRKEKPPKMRGRDGYRKAREHLRRDFAYRCAYCMIHESEAGGEEAFWIDHFRPRSKGGSANDYTNLYWACILCNHIKGDSWPTPSEARHGRRFANPCHEQDYGFHFAENAKSELEALTRCGEYHVGTLRLNRSLLVARRRERNEYRSRLAEASNLIERLEPQRDAASVGRAPVQNEVIDHVHHEIDSLRAELAIAIPFIPSLQGQ